MDQTTALLEVKNLSVSFKTYQGRARVLDRASLTVHRGEIMGLVGETGCGKSVLSRAVLRIIPSPPGRIDGGEIRFDGRDLLTLPKKAMRALRGDRISMIFQEPMSSLNPVFTVGNQMREVIRAHRDVSRATADAVCLEMLAAVRLPEPESVLAAYPHELSGGMRQRVMIAMELSCRPALLLADEPTTALDVTVQGQILAILAELSGREGLSILLVTHDMGVVAQLCRRVAVMYAGQVVEVADVESLFARPAHPYTRGLIASIPGRTEGGELYAIPGSVPSPIDPPPGCRFHSRCAQASPDCRRAAPEMVLVAPDHTVACHRCSQEGRS
ncbi:ABC transporter ATP-binding protein [Desulfolutivibrio sulfoxidireducens]|uniref:ABC transporter ATP-binding protein n=1 Tax=Desulfolutivibrio sulfoxidireducens TaxID=2773299 RepID=UPI00159E2E67|nr:ABC transporter ATP-binding protein [Desulfolutivibrio sulfoxidireducens]QLA16327.1 ATP-binding cassette domain-containing protein [Desulfolutivibrio sulfoxidireducens]QLA19782.1 ATP-binding cassette domain-containing protein [Desulfolutivibrio sulfoxidireducens]